MTSVVVWFQKLETLENMMVRCCGALFLAWTFIYLYATSFRYDEDRSNLFVASIVVCNVANLSLFYDNDLLKLQVLLT